MISWLALLFTNKALHVVGENVVGTMDGMDGFTVGAAVGTVGFAVDMDRKVGLVVLVGLRETLLEGEAVGRSAHETLQLLIHRRALRQISHAQTCDGAGADTRIRCEIFIRNSRTISRPDRTAVEASGSITGDLGVSRIVSWAIFHETELANLWRIEWTTGRKHYRLRRDTK